MHALSSSLLQQKSVILSPSASPAKNVILAFSTLCALLTYPCASSQQLLLATGVIQTLQRKSQDKQLEARDQNLLRGVEAQVLLKITGIQNTILSLPRRDPALGPPKKDVFIQAAHCWRGTVLPCGSSAPMKVN